MTISLNVNDCGTTDTTKVKSESGNGSIFIDEQRLHGNNTLFGCDIEKKKQSILHLGLQLQGGKPSLA